MHSSIPSYCVCYMDCRNVGSSTAFSHTLHVAASSPTILFSHILSHSPLQTVFSPCSLPLHLTYSLHFSLPYGIPPPMPHFSFLNFTGIQVKYTWIWSWDLYMREHVIFIFLRTSFSIFSSSIHLLANFMIIIILLLNNILLYMYNFC